MSRFLRFVRNEPALVPILLGSAALRLLFLDYSHFQGDEVSALYPVGVPFPTSLLEQLKGPLQLLVTFAVHRVTGGYGEWQTRLPFSLASILGVSVVYLYVRDAFGRRQAVWAAALVGSCGLIVAFGRIVQYQAFVMLTVSLTALCLLYWIRRDQPRYLYVGLASFAVSTLAHYDALTFVPALLLLLVSGFLRPEQRTWRRLRHVILAGALAVGLAGLFYGPFVFRPGFVSVTSYLGERVVGDPGWETFRRTGDLLALYLPPLYLPLVAVFGVIGVATALRPATRMMGLVVTTWFAAPFAFYMFLGGQPRSHVYMYLLPGLILAGLGLEAALAALRPRSLSRVFGGIAWVVLIGFTAMTYMMLIDHTIEHPWERKTVFGYVLPNLVSRRVQGVFGFPYRRGLDEVGGLFRSGTLKGTFDSNERDATMAFYIPAPRSSPRLTYFDDPGSLPPDYYLYVHRPFSFRRELPETVADTYRRIGTVLENGRTTIEIYAAPWTGLSVGAEGPATVSP